jgi:hypothetical protein
LGSNTTLLSLSGQDLVSYWDEHDAAAFGAGQDPFLGGGGDLFLLGSRLGPDAFRAGQDPFFRGW